MKTPTVMARLSTGLQITTGFTNCWGSKHIHNNNRQVSFQHLGVGGGRGEGGMNVSDHVHL